VPVPAGEVAVIELPEVTVKLVAAVEPNLTAVAPAKPVPVIVTEVPPAAGPTLGSTLVTVGPYVKRSASLVALVLPGAVTGTSTVPVPAGEAAVGACGAVTVELVAAVEPSWIG